MKSEVLPVKFDPANLHFTSARAYASTKQVLYMKIERGRWMFYDDRPRKTGSVNFAYFLKSCQAAYAPTS
jgi:hypothetical protein